MTTATCQTEQKTTVPQTAPQAPAPLPAQRVAELVKLERQLIPVLNTIRAELGKRPVIVPKE